jgi:hypothetical protein
MSIYQLSLWLAIFFAIFLRLPPNKFSAGRFTSFDPVGFAIFATPQRVLVNSSGGRTLLFSLF